ncbi:hypothetical protein HRE53_17605 [Acaryochloris sp. 'Moss Beach']|uniref:hypothetical protein n=1 Tax=Acaryochloris sp. 'Moss Beach' TaxID=2740837 RepID=UPI001F244447|nr:hypothetical protein [Acaryochloris sp. 'Moss Beach']UJB68356.1 hypothetical protein HRE53_17605 [Acaryochloris sp. 'Moss Beach']
MTKVSSLPQNIWHWFADHVISPVRHTFWSDVTASVLARLKQFGHRWSQGADRQRLGVWFIALTGAFCLMVWNGMLLVALSVGLGTALLIQKFHSDQRIWPGIFQWLSGHHSSTILSIGCGLLSLVFSYSTLLIWRDTKSFGLAFTILLQVLILLTILGLFLMQILKQDKRQLTPSQIDYWIKSLTALDPLTRLIAVRQLSHFATFIHDQNRDQEIKEYLQLLSKEEPEVFVQSAIAEVLGNFM